jgi:FkbM family methyltransferase
MRRLIAHCWLQIQRHTPDLRGKQWCSRALAQLLGPVPLRSAEGILLGTRLGSAMDISFVVQNGGGHELIRQAISNLKPGNRMLDVGANTGYMSILASRRVGPSGCVIAVEPSQREFLQLLANIKLNRVNNVLALNIAAGDRAGISDLTVEADHTGLNRIEHNNQQNTCINPCLVLPLSALELGYLDLVKIDTEGFELFALRGLEPQLSQQLIRKLVVEISPLFLQQHQQTSDDIYNLLASHGYRPRIGPLKSSQWDEEFEIDDNKR